MTVYVVPPPMNTGWPEVDFFYTLLEAGGVPFIDPTESHSRDYQERQWNLLLRDFLQEMERYGSDESLPDTWLFCEAFHPAALYLRSLYPFRKNQRQPYLVGMMHGGSFVPGDNLAQKSTVEAALLEAYDMTLACVEYQKDIQERETGVPSVVTPYPLHPHVETVPQAPQGDRRGVVFPHRQIPEKGFELFQSLQRNFTEPFHAPSQLSKYNLFSLFGKSKVVFANSKMELFGTAVEEALAMGCIAVLNTHPAYIERYKDKGYPVVWHDGTLDSASNALDEALAMQQWEPYPYAAGTSVRRAKHILDVVEGLSRDHLA